MKSPTALLLALALAATPIATLAADGHSHGKQAHHQLSLNAGKKWGTDEALRKAMATIHASVVQALPIVHSGKATVADYNAFGKDIEAQVAYIVENCKLDPKADAQLHVIVAEMLQGVETAQGKHGEKNRASGVVTVAQASNAYGKFFSHAGWQTIQLAH